jgi:hypothetical protein
MYSIKKYKLNQINKILKKWRFNIKSIKKQFRIKTSLSKNLNQMYLAVLIDYPKQKKCKLEWMEKIDSDLDFLESKSINLFESKMTFETSSSQNKVLFQSKQNFQKGIDNFRKNENRMDFEEKFPLIFDFGGDFCFENPLKFQFNDPQFIVFYQKLKRIIMPSLGNLVFLIFLIIN